MLSQTQLKTVDRTPCRRFQDISDVRRGKHEISEYNHDTIGTI